MHLQDGIAGERGRWVRRVVLVGLGLPGLALWLAPGPAPRLVFLGLVTTAWPLGRAWRGARGTALRPALCWALLAVGLGLAAQAAAWSEPLATGRPLARHWEYVAALAALAAFLSVLNARSPGGGAWALLMALLILVFLLPWLEGPGLARGARGLGRVRLDAPWTIFYWLLVVAGVTNFFPTRYGPGALALALGFLAEYLGLTRGGSRWVVQSGLARPGAFSWLLSLGLWLAHLRSNRGPAPRSRLEAVWLWFRDHWGVVWALRTQERFNRSAEALRWPVRLGWYGVLPAPGAGAGEAPAIPDAAEATLVGLLRRFADPARVAEAVAGPCQPPGPGG